jgi:hypothetical protein
MENPSPDARKRQVTVWYVLAAMLGVLLFQWWWASYSQVETIPYSQFESLLEQDKVAQVTVSADSIQGTLKEPLPNGKRDFFVTRVDPQLAEKLARHQVVVTGVPSGGVVQTILSWVIPAVIFYLIWMFLFRHVAERQGFGGLMTVGKSRAKVYVETDTKVTFKDVAGVDEAKFELQELVAFLRNPKSYGRLGARVPKGVLLVGRPGPVKRCWRKRSLARRACHSFPFLGQSSSKCSLASAQRGCAICSSKRARRRPALFSLTNSMHWAVAACRADSAEPTRKSRRSISFSPSSTASIPPQVLFCWPRQTARKYSIRRCCAPARLIARCWWIVPTATAGSTKLSNARVKSYGGGGMTLMPVLICS